MKYRLTRPVALGVALVLIAAACGGGDDIDVSGVCPDPLIVQTDWFVEPEHGYTYQLIGTEGTFDAENGVYSGPLGDTGVTLEIRQGGPFVGFSPPVAQMYSDDAIFMGYADTATVIKNFATLPAVHVFAPLDIGPQMIMWDPAVYPDVQTIEDVRDTGMPVLHFPAAYMDYLLANGLLNAEQTDDSYDGSPSRFVAEGNVFQQGFATNEVYTYENDIDGYMKPVNFLLTHDTGFEIYQSAMSVKQDKLEANRDCVAALVPLMQQAQVDYMANPEPMNAKMLEMVAEMDTFWTLSAGGTADAVVKMLDLDMVSNAGDSTIGDMDADRIQSLIDIWNPIVEAQGLDGYKADITPSDVFTNEFIDDSIGLP